MYPPNLKCLALPDPEKIGGSQNIRAVSGYAHAHIPYSPKLLSAFHIPTTPLCALLLPQFAIGIFVWSCESHGKGRGP